MTRGLKPSTVAADAAIARFGLCLATADRPRNLDRTLTYAKSLRRGKDTQRGRLVLRVIAQ